MFGLEAAAESEVGAWLVDLGDAVLEGVEALSSRLVDGVAVVVACGPVDGVEVGVLAVPGVVVLFGSGDTTDPPVDIGVGGVSGGCAEPVAVNNVGVDGQGGADAVGPVVGVGVEGVVDHADPVVDGVALPGEVTVLVVAATGDVGVEDVVSGPHDLVLEASHDGLLPADVLGEPVDLEPVGDPSFRSGGELLGDGAGGELLDALLHTADLVLLDPADLLVEGGDVLGFLFAGVIDAVDRDVHGEALLLEAYPFDEQVTDLFSGELPPRRDHSFRRHHLRLDRECWCLLNSRLGNLLGRCLFDRRCRCGAFGEVGFELVADVFGR